MKRDLPDFFYVEPGQLVMHQRLENWARWVRPKLGTKQHPMWAGGRSNARQWHQPETVAQPDELDGQAMEKAVGALPIKECAAIRWCYVLKTGARHKARELAVSDDGLMELVVRGRRMLINRKV